MPRKLDFTMGEKRQLVGRRIRRRRLSLNLTQARLGQLLGVTAQQLQKYETGAVAVSPARLREIAYLLGVLPGYFALAQEQSAMRDADAFETFACGPDALALHRALASLADENVRRQLIAAILVLCESHARPEDADVALPARWLRRIVLTGDPPADSGRLATDIRALKTQMAKLVGKTLAARKYTQKYSAQVLNVHQARISAFARGDVRALSFEKLLRYVTMLGWRATLAINRQTIDQPGTLELRSGPEQ